MIIYIDTSAFYALLDRDDKHHQKAKKAWAAMLSENATLVTSNYVLVECCALLQNRLGMEAVSGFNEDMLPLVTVEYVTAGMHRSGLSALLAARRRNLSLVDCVSFEVMRTAGIRNVFAFDPHFAEQGFILIP